jgi:hypothetical protein
MKGSDIMKQCFQMKYNKKNHLVKFGKKISLKFDLVQLITHAHMPLDFLI